MLPQVKETLVKQYQDFVEQNRAVIEKAEEADLISARDMYNSTLVEEEEDILEAKQLRRHNEMANKIRVSREELSKLQFRTAQESFNASS